MIFTSTLKPDPDDYKSWPLEKLQREYSKLKTQNALKGIQLVEMEATVKKAQAFIDAFNAMVDREDER